MVVLDRSPEFLVLDAVLFIRMANFVTGAIIGIRSMINLFDEKHFFNYFKSGPVEQMERCKEFYF